MSRSPSLDQVLASLPPTVLPLLEALASQTRRARGALYLVGGPVRDVLLGRPIGDVDLLVVPGRKAGSIARSAAPPEAKVTEYGRFGTLRIEVPDGGVDVAGVVTADSRSGSVDSGVTPQPYKINVSLGHSLVQKVEKNGISVLHGN